MKKISKKNKKSNSEKNEYIKIQNDELKKMIQKNNLDVMKSFHPFIYQIEQRFIQEIESQFGEETHIDLKVKFLKTRMMNLADKIVDFFEKDNLKHFSKNGGDAI